MQRKPPVPTAAAATSSADAQVAAGARTANNARDGSLRRDKLSPRRSARRAKSPGNREIAAERGAKRQQGLMPSHDHKAGGCDAGRGASRGSDRKHLMRMLR